MKSKVELKKTIIKFIIVTIIGIAIFSLFLAFQYRVYTKSLNNKIGSIISEVAKENPEIEKNKLIEIVNSKDNVDEKLLEKYGIDIDKDSIILNNDGYFKVFVLADIALLLLLDILIFFIFLKYNYNKNKKLTEITKYIEEINKRNYKLDIDDNTEDELSILKNEIYKVTVNLKEIAENSKKDKINLKDSLSDISHQLKTPLTSITVMLDNILENPQIDENTKIEFIKDIKRQVVNISFLIDSLLKLSKLDANSIHFINNEEFVKNILDESIKNVEILCDLKNIKINLIGEDNIKIFCDKKWQIEAITNILKNGIEHSEENSKIDVNFEQNKIYTKIEIKDYGVGIDKKDLNHIFERFYKGKNSSSDSVGIGLALSKSIIEKSNGDISVSSVSNQGTTFAIKYFNEH